MIGEEPTLAVPVSSSDHLRGKPSAGVTLVEYGDYECPACASLYPLVRQIQQRYAGDLCFVFRNFPLAEAHPLARPAAELAEAAALLDRFWPMHDWLFENQEGWVPYGVEGLQASLRDLGIDESEIGQVLGHASIDARIRRDFMGGVRSGVNGTPSFFINGQLYQDDFESLEQTIGAVLAGDQ